METVFVYFFGGKVGHFGRKNVNEIYLDLRSPLTPPRFVGAVLRPPLMISADLMWTLPWFGAEANLLMKNWSSAELRSMSRSLFK